MQYARLPVVWPEGLVNSTGGRDRSAMMAGCKSQRPTGGGVQYGTACLFRGARLD